MNYSPEAHTPQTLMRQVEGLYQRQPDIFLVGSLGRAAAYDMLTGVPYHEFDQSSIVRRPDGTTRDIDVVNIDPTLWFSSMNDLTRPFTVDNFTSPRVGIENKIGTWVLKSKPLGFEAELDARLMEPVHHRLLGVDVVTFHPQTHMALLGIKGDFREKDFNNKQKLQKAINNSDINLLPPELFEPFEELQESWTRDFVLRARDVYRQIMPKSIHRRLTPVHMKAMKLLGYE
ncbi:hypothetical protein KW794_00230 [Candidatus Saccharibacteria bacterium]|nr:hypothetical protein [Candidatus Saccharibacteria bacterium]